MSGATLKRPGLDQIRDMAANQEVQAVIVAEQDRLSRSLAHTMLLVEEFERQRVELLFVREPQDDTPEGRMLFQMKGMFKEYERAKIAERSRRGKERRAKEGKVLGAGVSPFGYRYVLGEGRYELVESEAVWVPQMFDWVASQGCSLYEVARRLNDLGIPTKQGAPNWSAVAVRGVLKNTMYAGVWYWRKTRSVAPKKHRLSDGIRKTKGEQTSRVQRDSSEWVAISLPPLVTQDVYEAVQRQLTRNRAESSRNSKHCYVLRGVVTCHKCGSRLRGHATRGWRYYECTARHSGGNGPLRTAQCRPYNADKLEEMVWDAIVKRFDPDTIMAALQGQRHDTQRQRERDDAELQTWYDAEQKTKREEDEFLDLYVSGLIDREKLQTRLSLIKQRREAIARTKSEVLQRIEQYSKSQADADIVEELCRDAQVGLPFLASEDKRAFLSVLQVKIQGNGEKFYMTGLIGDAVLTFMHNVKAKNGAGHNAKPPSHKTEGSDDFGASPVSFTPRRLPRR
jgi:site-specific DNA recombinase